MVNTLILPFTLLGSSVAPVAGPADDTLFGLNGSKVFHIIGEEPEKVRQRLDWMNDLGVHWDRSDLWWHVVEPEPGEWDFSRAEDSFDILEEYGVQWYPILAYGSARWMDERTGVLTEEERELYAEYVYRTVDRFKDRAKIWSLWNEPNIPNFWSPEPNPDLYYKLVEAAYPRMKEADPEAQMATLVLAPVAGWDREFTDRFFRLGGMEFTDIFDYHFYRHSGPEEDVPVELAEIRALMHKYGEEKPIWITESGVSSNLEGVEDFEKQASLAIRHHLVSLAHGVDRFFYFDLQNWYDDRPEEWDSTLGLVTAAGEPKPSYYAYQTMVDQIDETEVIGEVPDFDGGEAVLFYDGQADEFILAAWNPEDNLMTVPIDTAGDAVEVTFPEGETEEMEARDGAAEVPLTRHPVYVRGVSAATYLPRAGVKPEFPLVIAAPGDDTEVEILANMPNVDYTYVAGAQTPTGITWDAESGTVSVAEETAPGMYPVEVSISGEVTADGESQTFDFTRTFQVEVTPSLNVSFRPMQTTEGIVFNIEVDNLSQSPRTGSVSIIDVESGDALASTGAEDVGAAATEIFTLVANDSTLSADNTAEPKKLRVDYGDFQSETLRFMPVPIANEDPTIDADLSEWSGVPAMQIGSDSRLLRGHATWSPSDASADVHVMVDEEALFVAVNVTDDDPALNEQATNMLWREDSLELYVGIAGPSERSVLNKSVDFQLGLAPTHAGDEPIAFWYHEDVVLDTADVAATVTDTGYIIEARIPWSAIGLDNQDWSAGQLIGLTANLNDYDEGDWAPAGNVPGRALTWQGDGTNWINPSRWGVGVLVSPNE
jgi:hypothetical protein